MRKNKTSRICVWHSTEYSLNDQNKCMSNSLDRVLRDTGWHVYGQSGSEGKEVCATEPNLTNNSEGLSPGLGETTECTSRDTAASLSTR
jgi:hypothetical protein